MTDDERAREIAALRERLRELEGADDQGLTSAPPHAPKAKGGFFDLVGKVTVGFVGLVIGGSILAGTLTQRTTDSPPLEQAPETSTEGSTPTTVDLDTAATQPSQSLARPSTGPTSSPTSTPPSLPLPPPRTAWRYTVDRDGMSDGVTRTACVQSSDRVQQSFPYEDTGGRLCVRDSPRWGIDVYLSLNGDGQILCSSFDDCTIRVRFDDGAAQSFSAVGPADHSTTSLFFRNASRAITGLRSADQTRIEFQLYQQGTQYLTFPTAGLTWPVPDEPNG